ncbi:MAG: MFS transporter [Saprospiraceae bacterium]
MYQNLRQLYIDSFSGLTRDIWLLSFITFINRSGSVVFLFLSIYLTTQLGFSKGETGIIMAFHGVGSVAGGFIGGWLTDRIGYYRVMFWSLILVGFLFLLLYWVKTFWMFCFMGFLTSTVGDAFRPAGMASITIYGGEELRTRSMSLYRLAINFGFGFGIAAAGFLAGFFGYGVLFFVDGGTCILAAILFIILMKEKKEVQKISKDDAPKIIKHSAYKDNWYLMFVACWFLNAMVFIQLFYTFPVFCKEELMMSEEGFGGLMSFNGILIGVIEMPLIYILAKKRDQMGYIIWGVVLIGMSLVIFNVMGFTIYAAIVSMTLFSIGEIINFPLASSLALGRSNPNNRGQYMGLYSMSFSVGLILAPLIGFTIAEDYGYAVLWNFMGGLAVLATVGLMYLRKKEMERLDFANLK